MADALLSLGRLFVATYSQHLPAWLVKLGITAAGVNYRLRVQQFYL